MNFSKILFNVHVDSTKIDINEAELIRCIDHEKKAELYFKRIKPIGQFNLL